MDVDRIFQLLGRGFKRVYGYYVKRPLQRFNVDNRAVKAVEQQKTIPKAAPRHESTDQLFKQIIQNNPHFRTELNEKREDLLKRLQTVKVVSKDVEMSEQEIKEMEEMRERTRSRLPQSREVTDIPIHAYIEPDYVPKGRISLLRALDFIGKHTKDPEEYDSQTIAKQHQLDEEEVKHILEYFKPFYRYEFGDPTEDPETVLGIPKQQYEYITTSLKSKSRIREEIEASGDHKSDESQSKEKIESKEK